jgi:hypothetical protein
MQRTERVTSKLITNLCFKMFQCYDFKVHLGLAYVANLEKLSNFKLAMEGILSLGVQLLTIDDITLLALKDPVLCQTLTSVFDARLKNLIEKVDREASFRMSYLIHDLKYMCKPLVAPVVIH